MTKRYFKAKTLSIFTASIIALGLSAGLFKTHAMGIAYNPIYPINVTQQKIAVYYDEKAKTETLILAPSYSESAKDFAIVIPIPSEPKVSTVPESLFTSLQELTQITYPSVEPLAASPLLSISGVAVNDRYQGEPVKVIDSQNVDVYTTTVIKPENKEAMKKWLTDNGYQVGSEYVLNEYINKGYYFVTAKISSSANDPFIASQLRLGKLNPIQISFNTENPFIPMKLLGAHNAESKAKLGAYSFESGSTQGWYATQPIQPYVPGQVYDQSLRINQLTVNSSCSTKFGTMCLSQKVDGSTTISKGLSVLNTNRTYTFSAYVKTTPAAKGAVSLSVLGLGVSQTTEASKLGAWTRLSVSFKPSTTYITPTLTFTDLPTGTTVYVDAIQIEEGNEPSEFTNEKTFQDNSYNNGSISTVIYVISNEKKKIQSFGTEYAGFVKENKVEELAKIDDKKWIDVTGKKFVTKLTKYMTDADMTSDLEIVKADDNKPVGSGGFYIENPIKLSLIVIIPIAIEFGVLYLIFKRRK